MIYENKFNIEIKIIMKILSDFTKNWKAKSYLKQYYSSGKINSDEIITLKYLVNYLKSSNKIFERAIDVGSGPTLHQIIPLIPYVKELHLADFLPENLKEIKKWLSDSSDAHSWGIYTQYVLELEGRGEGIEIRENNMRKKITKLLPIDIYRHYPLGVPTTYSLVTSFYCADSVAKNKKDWKRCMANIFTLVEPGGVVILAALRNADSYNVLDHHFSSPHVDENDFKALFEEYGGFVDSNIDIQILSNPEWTEAGFDSCIFVKAEKRIQQNNKNS